MDGNNINSLKWLLHVPSPTKYTVFTFIVWCSKGHRNICFKTWSSCVFCEVRTIIVRRMPSSGTLRRVALLRTDFSEEPSASIIRVKRICELRTTLAVTSNRRTLRRNTEWPSSYFFAACVGCQLLLTLFLAHCLLSP
jgi:hypothetical protein